MADKEMAQLLLNLSSPSTTASLRHLPPVRSSRQNEAANEWSSLLHSLKSDGRFSCLFSGNNREDQARKALEGALGGKRDEFEKWDKEIKKREEVGGGSSNGGGGWFGWGRRFGWSNEDDFWQEAQQATLAVLGIFLMYLIVVKGELMLAVVFNPLLYALRGTRNSFTFVTNKILRRTDAHADFDSVSKKEAYSRVSAKESVTRKWGSE